MNGAEPLLLAILESRRFQQHTDRGTLAAGKAIHPRLPGTAGGNSLCLSVFSEFAPLNTP
jgi:hypothetical protein